MSSRNRHRDPSTASADGGRDQTPREAGARLWIARLATAALLITIGSVLLAAFSLFAWVRYDVQALPAVLRGVDFVAVAFSVSCPSPCSRRGRW